MRFKTENFALIAFQTAIFISLIGLNPSAGGGGEGSVLRQGGWILLTAACVLSIFVHGDGWQAFREHLRRRMGRLVLITAVVLFAFMSASWSEAPLVTIKRSALLGFVVLISLVASIHAAQSRIGLSRLLLKPLSLILLLSVLISLVAPGVAFSSIGWQGAAGHKNEMGQLAALLVLTGLFGGDRPRAVWRTAAVFAGVAALGLSRSGTATVCLAAGLFAVGVVWFASFLKRRPSWSVPTFMLVLTLLAATFAAFVFDALPNHADMRSAALAVLGKSETLTGRTALWDLVLEQSRYRSDWIGGGYGAFWDISYTRIAYIVGRLGFMPIQAHNGYLDIFNDLGFVGLGLVLSIIASYLMQIVVMAFRHPASGEAAFHMALCVYVVLANFSESSIFRTTQFLNLLFLFSLIFVCVRRPSVSTPTGAPSCAVCRTPLGYRAHSNP